MGAAWAEGGASGERGSGREGGNRSAANREEMRARMTDRQVRKIAEELDLDEATTARLKELMEKSQAARRAHSEQMKAEMEKLKGLVDGSGSDAAIGAQLDKLASLRDQMHVQQKASQNEIRELLGARDSARVLMMMQERMQNMRENLRERVGSRREGRGGSRDGAGAESGNWGYTRP
jgi:Spy/CpxP family protein refolding chaperone